MNKKLLIIILVVVLAAGGALYFFVFRGNSEPKVITDYYSPGEAFVSNVAESPSRMFKTSIVLVLNNDKLQETLTEENARIRDAIIFVLCNLTDGEIRSPGKKDEIRIAIINAVNEALGIDNVVGVLFNDFVLA